MKEFLRKCQSRLLGAITALKLFQLKILVKVAIWTCILQLNIIIAMMSNTYDKKQNENNQMWILEIFSRIIRYEKQFPELWPTSHKPHKVSVKQKRRKLVGWLCTEKTCIIRCNCRGRSYVKGGRGFLR